MRTTDRPYCPPNGSLLLEDEMRKRGEQRGSLRERNGHWYVIFRQLERDEQGNVAWQRAERAVGPSRGREALSRRAAERLGYDEFVAPANAQQVQPGGVVAFGDFYSSRYVADCVPTLSQSWRKSMASIMKNHILPSFGPMPLSEIDTRRIQILVASKLEAGYSTQTIDHIRKCISTVLRHARRIGYITGQLPTEDVVTPTVRHKEKRALSLEQLRMLAGAMPMRWRALVLVMGWHGLRIGEAAGIQWRDVNLSDKPIISDGELIRPYSILVRVSWDSVGRELKETKSDRLRHIPLVAETWVAMMEHRDRAKNTDPDAPVFAGRTGQPVDAHNVRVRSLRTAATSIGCPWVTWHVLRHTSSTLADIAGLTIAEKQKILGHATPEMSTHYTHPEIERVRVALETLGAKSVQ